MASTFSHNLKPIKMVLIGLRMCMGNQFFKLDKLLEAFLQTGGVHHEKRGELILVAWILRTNSVDLISIQV